MGPALETLSPSALLVHHCKVAGGSSGAPLLLMGQHGVVIVGLQVAVGQSKGGEITCVRAKHRKHARATMTMLCWKEVR